MRVLVLLLVLAGIAHAQGAKLKSEAQQHLDASLKAYANKDFDTALHELDLAYAIDAAPALMYMKAQTLRLAGKCELAIDVYKRYLELKLTAEQVTAAKLGIDTCEKTIAAAPKPAIKTEPVVKPEPKPEPRPEPKPEPPKPIDVKPAEPMPVILPPPADQPRWYADPIGDSLVIGGAIGIGVGAVFLVKGTHSQDAAAHETQRDVFLRDLDAATSQRRIGVVALGAGSALAIGGIVVLVMHHQHASHSIAASTDGHSIFVAGSF